MQFLGFPKRRYNLLKRIFFISICLAVLALKALAADEPTAVTTTTNDAALQVTSAASVTDTAVTAVTNTAASVTLEAKVHGRITELGSPDPVEDAQVQVEGTTLTAISDSKGNYRINLQAGYSILVFSGDGYSPRKKKVSIRPGHDLELNVSLEKVDFTSEAVVVTAKKDVDQVVSNTLTQQEIKKIPGTTGDALRAVQDLPGVAAINDFSSQLVVQGGGPNDNLYLLDNIPWPTPFHFGGIVSTVDSDLVSSVELNGAGFGAKWGDYMDSVLDVKTRAGQSDRLHMTADINLLMSQILLEGPLGLGDATFTLTGRRSYIDLLLGSFIKGFGFTALPAFWDVSGTLNFSLGPDNHFRGLALTSDDSLSLVLGDNSHIQQSDVNSSLLTGEFSLNNYSFTSGISWINTSLQNFTSTLTPYYYRTSEDDIIGIINANTAENYFGIKEEAVWDIGEVLGMKNEIGIGGNLGMIEESDVSYLPLENTHLSLTVTTQELDTELAGTTINSRVYEQSVYLQDHIQINKQWAFIPGVRYDKRDDIAHDTLLPRLRLEYQYDDTTLWKAAWGYYSQFPTAGQTNPNLGNPDLSANIAEHMVVSVEKKFSESLTGNMDVYYKSYTNLVGSVTGPPILENNGSGIARGVDFFLQERTDRFFGWISYSLSDSWRNFPSTGWQLYEYDQPNILNIVGSYNITPAWSLGAKLRYNSGPLVASSAGSDIYNKRLADYIRIDMRTDYTFRFEGWKLNCYFEILNVLDRQNPAMEFYPSDGSAPRIVNNLPIFPYLGVEFEF